MVQLSFSLLIEKIRGYERPYSLSLDGWDEWEEKTKKKYPIRYLLFETLTFKLRYFINRIIDVKWWFLHRFHPKYRYHVIKTDLKPRYYDTDTRILYNCFKLLNDFIEHEADSIDWKGSSDEHFEAYCTMKELWYWWNCIRPTEWENFYEEHFTFEKEYNLMKKDNEQLKQLMSIRSFLWS